jgi:hypothetical protein
MMIAATHTGALRDRSHGPVDAVKAHSKINDLRQWIDGSEIVDEYVLRIASRVRKLEAYVRHGDLPHWIRNAKPVIKQAMMNPRSAQVDLRRSIRSISRQENDLANSFAFRNNSEKM